MLFSASCSKGSFVLVLGFVLVSAVTSLKGSSWQKRIDRAFLQVDGVTLEGRFRSLQRGLQDPELRTDVSKAIGVIREKGFGKGHPESIEILFPEGTQARKDLEAMSALTKQLGERRSELAQQGNSTTTMGNIFETLRSTQEGLAFGGEKASPAAVVSSLVQRVRSDPKRARRLAENFLRNSPVEVESPSYELLGQYYYSDDEEGRVPSESEEDEKEEETVTKKKSFLTVPQPLELRRYDAFRSVSVPLPESDAIYTLSSMAPALTEIFSYLELGNNGQSSLMNMTTPFFVSGTATDGSTKKMFVKLPEIQESNPPHPVDSSKVVLDSFPGTVLAILSFPGICTDEEIARQRAKLLERIEAAGDIGWKVKQTNETTGTSSPELFVLQYNAPDTLPWRRMNEIAVAMEKNTVSSTSSSLESEEDEVVDSEAETDSDENESALIEDVDRDIERVDDDIEEEKTADSDAE